MASEDTRDRIIDTALHLFSTQGYDLTTTRSIAEEAGVNELTLFRNFGSKEKLLSEVMDRYFIEMRMKIEVERPTGDPQEDLYRMITTVRGNLREKEPLFRLMIREASRNDIVASKMGQFPVMVKRFMLSRFEEALKGRTRPGLDLETAGVFFASYFIRSEIMRMMLGEDPFHEIDERRTREAIDILLKGILKEGSL
ncbi:MAG: TetR/AcrR family transcriptional regulator [Candidatus Thermoplasmatota archaeon]|nr:TetR/AcrR family transcriptional regulator [Candidatus Thermoplasmatota archaeon]